MASVLGLVVVLLAMPLASASPSPAKAPTTPTVERYQFPSASAVDLQASIGPQTLVINLLPNDSYSLVMYDASTNSSTTVQAVVPGGANTIPDAMMAAGGFFFIEWFHVKTSTESFVRVTTSGSVHPFALPLYKGYDWNFDFGNSTALFASASSLLLEIDPMTGALTANYTAYMPAGISLLSVLPVGSLLYAAGDRTISTAGPGPFFGFLNLTTDAFTTVTRTLPHYPSALAGSFYSLYLQGSEIYAGGAVTYENLTVFQLYTVAGLFYGYSTTGHTFQNLSAKLPNPAWGVYAIEAWHSEVVLSISGFLANTTLYTFDGGLYTLAHTSSPLVNQSALLGPGYVADVFGVTSEGAGYLVSGGENLNSDTAEVVAIHL